MGATWFERLRPVPVWLGVVLAPPALAGDLPPLPGESSPPAPVVPSESVRGRVEELSKGAENLRPSGSESPRFWFLDQPTHPTRFRLQDGLDFGTAGDAPAPSVAQEKPSRPETEPPARRPPVPAPKPPPDPRPAVAGSDPDPDPDPAAALAEAAARLESLPVDKSGEATPATRALRAVLEERVALLKERDRLVKPRLAAGSPENDPEKLAARARTDLERLKASLDQSARDPDALLPASFRNAPAHLTEPARAEMKEAIDAAQAELKEGSDQLEQLTAAPPLKSGAATAEARARRDKSQMQLAGLKARNADREAALSGARTPEARALAREALVNGRWESRVEAERLRGQEAEVAREARRADLGGLKVRVLQARTQLARKTLDRMKLRYRALAALEVRDLHQAAAKEETRAKRSADPLERYRARRAAELLELEVGVLKSESALATTPPPTYEGQHALAERARADFAGSRKLLDDGKISHLDALRLNTDFRRLGSERSRIVRTDLATAASRLTRAEVALGAVETELVYDSRDDRSELDNLLERLPPAAHPKAEALFKEFEAKHLELLNRRRAALDKVAQGAEEAHKEVLRRLAILDEHFGFIRTHMFWVRDEEPVGAATAAQAQRECRQLGRAAVRIGAEVGDRSNWGRLSAEFLAASVGLVVLPWPLLRARGALRRARPAPAARTDPAPRTEVSPSP